MRIILCTNYQVPTIIKNLKNVYNLIKKFEYLYKLQ